ncbi:MAG TPA: VWA domain-containing protein [Candidatus Limnocylindrales bacterium]|nr:VWA domain-containing protein [Candidatus Limnocylindrales bacterium]
MTFLWPVVLIGVALVPAWFVATWRIDARRRRRIAGLGGLGRETGGSARRGSSAARVATLLVTSAFVVLAVALARPQATVSLPRVEGTLVLTFDVSASMAADDVAPTRMEAAKAAAKAIVERQPPGVVVGVVAFSDAGLAVQTPTSDQAAVLAAIDRLAPSRGTSLGQGILASLGTIAQAESDTPANYYSNRSAEPTATPAPVAPGSHDAAAIVLFSDGENNERPDPMGAAQAAADRGIRIVTVGVGTAAGSTLDLDGFRVQSALDEAALRAVADLTAGRYEAADALDPATVYDQLSEHLVVRGEALELTAVFAAVGLLLLLGGTIVSLARSGRLP